MTTDADDETFFYLARCLPKEVKVYSVVLSVSRFARKPNISLRTLDISLSRQMESHFERLEHTLLA
jgi:hypothetical protein